MNIEYSVLIWLFLFMKEKFKVKLTEYIIRRIMRELSLYPDGIIRHVLGIYPRIDAFCFDSPIWEIKYVYLRRRISKGTLGKPFLSMTERKEYFNGKETGKW